MSGGSTMWSSMLTRIMSSSCMESSSPYRIRGDASIKIDADIKFLGYLAADRALRRGAGSGDQTQTPAGHPQSLTRAVHPHVGVGAAALGEAHGRRQFPAVV